MHKMIALSDGLLLQACWECRVMISRVGRMIQLNGKDGSGNSVVFERPGENRESMWLCENYFEKPERLNGI